MSAALSDDPVLQTLAAHGELLSSAPRLYLGFSGGLDSTVLLHAVAALHPGRLTALHADHGLQKPSDDWSRRCRALCEAWGVDFQSEKLAVERGGDGLEAAAREARYRWFESCVGAGELLLLAQHQDDQAETLLLRLLRGAGTGGLAAMPPRRDLGAGELLRPLLELPRSALEQYAVKHALNWLEDPSNEDRSFDRNYLRREVLPRIEERWPGYRKTLGRTARQLREWGEHAAESTLSSSCGTLGDPGFCLADLPAEPAAAAIALRGWLRQQRLRMPPAARLGEFLRQLSEGAGAQLCTAEWILERYREHVYWRPAQLPLPPADHSQPATAEDDWQDLGRVQVQVEGDGGELPHALLLRLRQPGDRLAMTGGGHSDLKTVFQRHQVPPWWRERVPLLVLAGSSDEEVLAVGGFASSPRARAMGLSLRFAARSFATG